MRTLSSVTPADRIPAPRKDGNASALVAEFVTDVANDDSAGGTYGAPHGRYVVGGYADSVVIKASATRGERAASAIAFAADRLVSPTWGIGFWRDANGRTWLDAVRGFDVPEVAIRQARANGELAIYDRETDSEITVAIAGVDYDAPFDPYHGF